MVCLLRSDDDELEVVWKERDGPLKSRLNGASQESILQKITVDVGEKGANLPKWFDDEQESLMNEFALSSMRTANDFSPIISICIVN
jgi:hypothetical protein